MNDCQQDPREAKNLTYKQVAKSAARKMAATDPVWRAMQKTVLPFARLLTQEHALLEGKNLSANKSGADLLAEKVFPDRRVKHGPFRGMEYPEYVSVGSALIPKLLGSYESEIGIVVERLCQIPYDRVLDIGSAEGYYAVGFAMRRPTAQITAYDTDVEARTQTEKMAALNKVATRVVTESKCTAETLAALDSTQRNLIFCDCDGCEKQLFTPETVQKLQTAEFLIEVHDFMDLSISIQLRDAFRATHDLLVMESIDDVRKARTYRYPELDTASLPEKRILVFEYRQGIQEWYFFYPKTHAHEFHDLQGAVATA